MSKFRKILSLVLFGIIFVLLGIFVHSSTKKEIVQIIPPNEVAAKALHGVPLDASNAIQSGQLINQTTFAKVTRVIDGDTIVIDTGEEVRYIGMNTPETETSECFATEASEVNENLVLGKTVRLEKDVSETDKYGRLLRYVYVGDTFIDDYLVKNGDARVMTVPPDTKYKDEFLQSENYAKENNLGLWGKCQ